MSKALTWALVIPTNRPEQFRKFLGAWASLLHRHKVYLVIVEDLPKKNDYSRELEGLSFTHLSQKDVPDYIPTGTDMIRSWGFYHVWENRLADYILTLDDDVIPDSDVFEEYEKHFKNGSVCSEYFSVGSMTTSGLQMRGFPYKDRKTAEVAVQYGGWDGVLDYDAATQLAVPKEREEFWDLDMPVPKGAAATCCIMNAAFKVEYTPIMWQLPMLNGRYNRVGDIWSGLFIKKTLDAIGAVMMITGNALVEHNRASNPYNSLQKEALSVEINDTLWEALSCKETNTLIPAYREVTDSAIRHFKKFDPEYAKEFERCRNEWLKLFENTL